MGKRYRTAGEALAYPTGNYTVPVGNHYRTCGEVIPYRAGSNTVPCGKCFEGFSCKTLKNARDGMVRLLVFLF